MHNYTWLKKGDWNAWSKRLIFLEYHSFPKGERTQKNVFKEFIDYFEPCTLVVTEQNDPKNLIAYFMCQDLEFCGDDLKKDDDNFGKGNTLYLFSIAVLTKWRGAGIGSVMMRKMIEKAKGKYERITLHTRNPSFEKLAMRFGFKKTKTVLLEGHRNAYMVKIL